MDPFTQMLIGSLISGGLGFLGGAVGGGGQELESFAGTGTKTSPVNRLNEAVKEIEALSKTAKGFAGEPVRLRSAFAQQPPTATGGGLPMPIGLSGVDPALADPLLLELAGIDFGSEASGDGGGPYVPNDPNLPQPGPADPGDPTDPTRRIPRRKASGGGGSSNGPTRLPRRKMRTAQASDARDAAAALQFLL